MTSTQNAQLPINHHIAMQPNGRQWRDTHECLLSQPRNRIEAEFQPFATLEHGYTSFEMIS